MDNAKQQIVERIRQANNVLVTVSTNPSVDQLAAAIGLTIMLNKLNKHATAVFSGEIPSTIEFLQPEQTLEKTTDSLRDFIIALDKSKADKLRYKVEDKVVRIFITPYRTSINEKDLEFSQGDFNVDVVVALGVHDQADLDQAITAHGRILHDATVTTISTLVPSTIGSINWQDASASSLSELVTSMSNELGKNILDAQIATALLTGIVAETERFSNDKTTPQTMSTSAQLMSAGANQQLVANKLEAVPETPPEPTEEPPEAPQKKTPSEPPKTQPPAGGLATMPSAPGSPNAPDGTLEISHNETKPQLDDASDESSEEPAPDELADQQIHIDDQGVLHRLSGEPSSESETNALSNSAVTGGSPLVTKPPTFGGTLTSESTPEALDPSTDALSLPQVQQSPLLDHMTATDDSTAAPDGAPHTSNNDGQTLSQIEQNVGSLHAAGSSLNSSDNVAPIPPVQDIDNLSNAAKSEAAPGPLAEPDALRAQFAFDNLHPNDQAVVPETAEQQKARNDALPNPSAHETMPTGSPSEQPLTMQLPPNLVPTTPTNQPSLTNSPTDAPLAPPPVPPPFVPPNNDAH